MKEGSREERNENNVIFCFLSGIGAKYLGRLLRGYGNFVFSTLWECEMVEKKKQNQPKHHAAKSKSAVKLRRKKIIKALAEGKTNQQAGVAAGLSPKTASDQVSQILSEPKTRAEFKALLEEVIPDDVQASKYLECLDATKVISAMVIAEDGEGMKDANSMTRDFVEVPDYAVQLKTNDSISKLKGHLVDKHEVDMSGALMALVKKQLNSGNGKGNHKGTNGKS